MRGRAIRDYGPFITGIVDFQSMMLVNAIVTTKAIRDGVIFCYILRRSFSCDCALSLTLY